MMGLKLRSWLFIALTLCSPLLTMTGCRPAIIAPDVIATPTPEPSPSPSAAPGPCSTEVLSQRAVLQGDGSEATPYEVATLTDLVAVSTRVAADYANYKDKYYKMICDVDASSQSNFTPIGTTANPFLGTFDGNGKTISSLTINATADAVGLFGSIGTTGVVKNLSLVGGTVSGSAATGALTGKLSGTIQNCSSSATVTSTGDNVGGLVGSGSDGKILHSYATGAVTGGYYCGGLVGFGTRFLIVNTYATGAVHSNVWYAAGLVAGNDRGIVLHSYSTGTPSGSGPAGLIYYNGGYVMNSFWDSTTSGIGTSDGGVAKTTAQLKQLATFSEWDFVSSWTIDAAVNNGYPSIKANPQLPTLPGDGTQATPYLIASAKDLVWMNLMVRTGQNHVFYKLTQDIDLAGFSSFFPIASATTPFSGEFDGSGHTISNLNLNFPGLDNVGLFSAQTHLGGADRGLIKDLTLSGGTVAGNDYIGSLVGQKVGAISNVQSNLSVSGRFLVGGLVGINSNGTITDSSTSGNVTAEHQVGGLVGQNNGPLLRTHATGNVVANSGVMTIVGGLVGQNTASITDSYATGSVSAGINVGGLVGSHGSGTISRSYSTGVVTAVGTVGGLVGTNSATITTSYSTSAVVVPGGSFAGGLVGVLDGNVSDSYARGSVSGENYIGGLAGYGSGNIGTSYATGLVTKTGFSSGGLFAWGYGAATSTNSFWDVATTGQATSTPDGGGETTAHMKDQALSFGLYSTWDTTTIWTIQDGFYPKLQWEP